MENNSSSPKAKSLPFPGYSLVIGCDETEVSWAKTLRAFTLLLRSHAQRTFLGPLVKWDSIRRGDRLTHGRAGNNP